MQHIKLTDKELRVMMAILHRPMQAYGPSIRAELLKRTGQDMSFGSLYSVLDRLSEKGVVESWMGEATAERGGKRKRYYQVNAEGQIAVSHALHQLYELAEGLDLEGLPGEGVVV